MSSFCVLRGDPATLVARRPRVERTAEEIGLPPPVWLDLPGGAVAFWPWLLRGPVGLWHGPDGDFALAAGTFILDGTTGAPALAAAWEAAAGDPLALRPRTQGQFALLLRRGPKVVLLHDRIGYQQLFHDPGYGVIATSFLLAARLADRLSVDPVGLLDYVLSGVPLGDATPVRELRVLPPTRQLAWDAAGLRELACPPALPDGTFHDGPESAAAACLAALRDAVGTAVAASGGEVACALSGGYDSRLLLALLREQGVTPHLFVYGGPDSADVRCARTIAAGEALALDHVDKSAEPLPEPEAAAASVHANFLAQDGYGQEGIFDNGGERRARVRRIAAAPLQLHGGGGETLRNFFHLRDRPFSARELAWTFWGQFDPAALVPPLDEAGYVASLARRLEQAVGEPAPPRLPRPWIEWLYPHFRCRTWVGREGSNNQRFSPTLMPFLAPEPVAQALKVPLALKQHGRFEAGLIARVSPRLAAYPSTYGHGFDRPPPLRRRLADALTLYRPPPVRRLSVRVQGRLKRRPALPDALQPRFLRAVLPDGPVVMQRHLRPSRLRDDQVQRFWSAEYLLRWLGLD